MFVVAVVVVVLCLNLVEAIHAADVDIVGVEYSTYRLFPILVEQLPQTNTNDLVDDEKMKNSRVVVSVGQLDGNYYDCDDKFG